MRILIVDDEEVSLAKLKTLLSAYGDCDTAASGPSAIELFKQAHADSRPYALVTMDVRMPGMSGQEAVSAIRTWEKEKAQLGARIIMVTVVQDLASVSTSIKSGSDGYLMKPFTPESVRDALSALGLVKGKLSLKLKTPPPAGS
jgi:two-component system, chemotaxis family, chemotaxis protein CheY